jgi:hypothetical protein
MCGNGEGYEDKTNRGSHCLKGCCPPKPFRVAHDGKPQTDHQEAVGGAQDIGETVALSKASTTDCLVKPTRSAKGAMTGMMRKAVAEAEGVKNSKIRVRR